MKPTTVLFMTIMVLLTFLSWLIIVIVILAPPPGQSVAPTHEGQLSGREVPSIPDYGFLHPNFAGVFEIVAEATDPGHHNRVDKLSYKNILTGGYNCSHNYHPVLLMSTTPTKDLNLTTKAFWCAPTDSHTGISVGLLFGGLFSTTSDNPVTKARTCPLGFDKVPLLGNTLTICCTTSSDSGLEGRFKDAFGGFFSCQAENPLSAQGREVCTGGFTYVMAAIFEGCPISYCLNRRFLTPRILPNDFIGIMKE